MMVDPLSLSEMSSGRNGLANFNEMPIRIAQVATDLATVIHRWCQEVPTARFPQLVNTTCITNSNIEGAAGQIGVDRSNHRHVWLIRGGWTTHVGNDPAVVELEDHGGHEGARHLRPTPARRTHACGP